MCGVVEYKNSWAHRKCNPIIFTTRVEEKLKEGKSVQKSPFKLAWGVTWNFYGRILISRGGAGKGHYTQAKHLSSIRDLESWESPERVLVRVIKRNCNCIIMYNVLEEAVFFPDQARTQNISSRHFSLFQDSKKLL